MLTVYGRATSSNVQALLWGLEELGLNYRRLDYGEIYGGLDSPAFQALTPHGMIPVLTVGEVAIWETPAILRYLAAEHGHDAFWPKDPLKRAHVDMWAEWAKHSVAEAFTGPVFWRSARTKAEHRDLGLIATNLERLEREMAKAEAPLARHDYLCGPSLTLADIQFGHVLYRYFDIDVARRALPELRRYYQRLVTRPAFQKVVMVSYDALKETL